MTAPTTTLKARLRWLGIERCTCPSEWRGLGTLYGISMGKGWVRMTTDQECPEHGQQGGQGCCAP